MFYANRVRFYLNDKLVEMDVTPTQTALEIIRALGATGAKEACSEGDCGACTVALGLERNRYLAVTSCIMPATKLHGRHVITVEGLGTPENLHPIQEVMYRHHATQCGFCTPGFIMSIFCLLANNSQPDMAAFRKALEGNLCRCTGYQHIVQAGEDLLEKLHEGLLSISSLFPDFCDAVWDDLEQSQPPQVVPVSAGVLPSREYHLCYSLDAALHALDADPQNSRVISGGTDLFVESNVARRFAENYIDVQRIASLHTFSMDDHELTIGAGVTLEELLQDARIHLHFPLLSQAIEMMGSVQIRNVATLAGNLGNASPVADGACALLGLDASVQLTSSQGARSVPLKKYYLGYKQTERHPDEIITAIILPRKEGGFGNFIKTGKRHNVDISSVSSALSVQVDASGLLTDVVLAYGGVKEYPALATQTMALLQGKKIDEILITEAMACVETEFTPIGDVRGTAEYRSLLIKNQLKKHLLRFIKRGEDA